MKTDTVIVRLGELTLKGRNRHRFEKQMMHQLQMLVFRAYPRLTSSSEFGRIYLQLNGEPYEGVAEALSKVFGLTSYSPAVRTELTLEALREAALEAVYAIPVQPKTFRVTVRRANKSFPHATPELLGLIGGHVLRAIRELKVDVHHPEAVVTVDIRDDAAYVFTESLPGAGGYPLGSNGKALLMLSGGIDSPVAGWLAMRRGLKVEAVHFHSYPFTSERAKQKVIDLAQTLSVYSGSLKLHMVSFTDIQTKLKQASVDNLMITLMRRVMLRIVEKIAGECAAGAIVTGDSLGQVASQTLPSLNAIGSAASLPLLRPLIMMDKSEIIRMAEQIGTFELSILPYEDCCTLFVPKSPSTNPNPNLVARIEQSLEWLEAAVEEAVKSREILTVSMETNGENSPNRPEEMDAYF
ncbi:tRNA uracil 4-sulfurtransferase ThiI [Paenibacillus sp. MBLB4367]|uniref:tRNA uracil 4-sulfurtransferase ThiI n=1 Tax=Paenibacillus sp. MBLB4367 TaxID=3384767 RepID=UPI0039083498